jgi:hypothetical protein
MQSPGKGDPTRSVGIIWQLLIVGPDDTITRKDLAMKGSNLDMMAAVRVHVRITWRGVKRAERERNALMAGEEGAGTQKAALHG